jgi:beta-galactosidase/beta-glucuronidase
MTVKGSIRTAGFPLPAILLAPLFLSVPLGPSARADVPTAGTLYQDGPSGRYLVSGAWYRRADPRDRGRKLGWQRRETLEAWQQTTVPNAANAGNYSARSYLGGVWWYRKDFELPRGSAGASWVLRFESVNYRSTVWLNGRRIGGHTGGYLPFEVLAKRLRRGDVNELVVRVDSRRGELDVPSVARRKGGRYVGGWWNYAGILREVYLRRVDRLDFTNVSARPELPCPTCPATVHVQAIVGNFGHAPANAVVEGRIGSQTISFKPGSIAGRGFGLFDSSARIDKPRLWSPAAPNLYRIVLRVRLNGRIVQRYTLHTGIRSIRVSQDGRLLLNGAPVSLRGASMHEDDPQRGAALGPAELRGNVDMLRDLGATMTRSHYPLHPLTLELADRYGILVWSEVPVYQMRDELFRRTRVRGQAGQLVRALVHRDRSHPSVLVWGLGNENTTRPGPGLTRYITSAARLARQLDPTRLVGISFQGYPTVGKQHVYTQLDALGVNDYFGWYPGPQGSIADRSGIGPYLERLHYDYPRQALFVTELGAEANRAGAATEKGTYAFQQDFLTYHLNVIAGKPFVNGALVWILKDFHVKPSYAGGNPKPDPPLNEKGLVDLTGARKPAFETVKRIFQAQPKAEPKAQPRAQPRAAPKPR